MIVALMGLLVASCSQSDEQFENAEAEGIAPVTVRVDEFAVSQEEFPDAQGARATTRATAVGDYDGVQKLTLAFYKSDGTETYKVTHTKGSMPEGQTFGEFSTTLPIGSYTMVVLGYKLYDDDELTLTSPTQAEWTVNAPRETFAATQEVNVTNTTALNLTATLKRGQIRIHHLLKGRAPRLRNITIHHDAGPSLGIGEQIFLSVAVVIGKDHPVT